jgi:hypothetical protein
MTCVLCVGYLSCSAGCSPVFTLSLNNVSAHHLAKWTALGRLSDLEYSTTILAFKQCIYYQKVYFPAQLFFQRMIRGQRDNEKSPPDRTHKTLHQVTLCGARRRFRPIVPCAVALGYF